MRLYATQDMYIEFEGTADPTGSGTNPIVSLSMFLPAGVLEYFAIPMTDSTTTGVIINAVRSTADGSLFITPLSS